MRFITWLSENVWLLAGWFFLIASFFPTAPDHYPYVALALFAFQALLSEVRVMARPKRVETTVTVNPGISVRDAVRSYERGMQ